jgi:CheY-like chemotaxis protein
MSQPTHALARSGSKKLIYVVDDKPALVELAKTVLALDGFVVEGFDKPADLLAALHKANPIPDLLVTDFDMPEMNGLQLIHQCRCVAPKIKIVVLSGTVEEHEVMSDSAKADRFLRKPYQPKQLIHVVNELLDVQNSID